jgi:hypothetical protein
MCAKVPVDDIASVPRSATPTPPTGLAFRVNVEAGNRTRRADISILQAQARARRT